MAEQVRIHDAISEEIIQAAADIAKNEGAHRVNVSRIMGVLGATNRVFYNRFKNADEVLRIVYERAVEQTRGNIHSDYTDCRGFVDFCLDTAERVLVHTYDIKLQFRRYVFEHDNLTEANRLWWAENVRTHYRIARERGYIREVDADALSYAIWCLFRGYISDAAARSVSLADSVRNFRFGFRCMLCGVLTASALQEISE